jgi:predicted P-loop ATPase
MLTVLKALGDHRACKVWDGDTKYDYAAGWLFEWSVIPVHDIHELIQVLEVLRHEKQYYVIRGALIPGAPPQVERRYKPKPDRSTPWIESAERQWVMIDVDKTDVPFNASDPEASVREYLKLLPEGLQNATVYWHLSSSQHAKDKLRCHLWYYLDREYTDRELKLAIRRLPGVDLSLYQAVQPHYTADPIFLQGTDPLPVRAGVIRGLCDVATFPQAGGQKLVAIAQQRLENACRKISRACRTDGEGRHPVVNKEAYHIGQLCPHLLTESEAYSALFAACTKGSNCLDPTRADIEVRTGLTDGMKSPELRGQDWQGELKLSKETFEPAPTPANVSIILENDIRWADVFAWDDRGQMTILLRQPPFEGGLPCPRPLDNEDPSRVGRWLQAEYGLSVPSKIVFECIKVVAADNRFDPVVDYLSGLEWDGEERLDLIPEDLLGDPSSLSAELFKRWMVSAVKRAFEPGCQADYALCLEGPVGYRKSSFFEWLSGGQYVELDSDLGSTSSKQKLQGPWIALMNELGALQKSKVEIAKGFLTTRVDTFRMPYGIVELSYPRKVILAATTNGSRDNPYVFDDTGGIQRRLWVVEVTKTVELSKMTPHLRDQLWSEAVSLYRQGYSTWELSEESKSALRERMQDVSEEPHDTWIPTLREFLIGKQYITPGQCLVEGLMFDRPRLTAAHRRRVCSLLRYLGWKQEERRDQGYRWVAPPDWPTSRPSVLKVVPNS